MGLIQLDFDEAIRKSNIMADCGQAILNDGIKLGDTESSISASWKGDSASLFLRKYDVYAKRLCTHGSNLKSHAESLRKSAEKLKKVEEYGVSLFSGR